MKRVFARFTIILLIMCMLIPYAVSAWSDNVNGSWKTAYAYQLTVIKYDGNGNPEALGKPILVYHPDLFQDVYMTTNTLLPDSYDSLVGKNWGFQQMYDVVNDTNQWEKYRALDQDALRQRIEADSNCTEDNCRYFATAEDREVARDLLEDPNLTNTPLEIDPRTGEVVNLGYTNRYVNINTKDAHPYTVVALDRIKKIEDAPTPTYNCTGYEKYSYDYLTKQKKITYHRSDIDTSQYYKTFADSNLTENNVNNGYLDTVIKTYAGSLKKVKDNFGIDLDYKDIDKYYISVEPVQRVLDGIKQENGRYFIDSFYTTIRNQECFPYSTGWRTGNIPSSKRTEADYNYSHKDHDGECTEEERNANGTAKRYTYRGNCYKNREVVNYYTIKVRAGLRIYKNMYGKYADGYSHLATSRSLNSGSVYLNRAVDYCNEDKNRHCLLEDDNKTCKRDSNGNVIYEYYIGPDRDKGITGIQNSNLYKLSGACYNGTGTTGLKHYYLQTLLDCPEVCTPSGDKTSDSFLACAENYCDAEVDFNRKGSPQKAKEACILTCGYKGNATSCESSSPYKNSNETNVNGSTTCNVNNNSANPLQGTIKTCTGDSINSFDGDDTNDTPFDLRKYITISCIETSTFKFKDTSKMKISKGSALDYYVNLNGQKTCQAYFNLDQWKFDYATISSKDPDRRKRLNYIKEVFNNIFSNTYDKTKSAYYDADFDEQGDGEIDWNLYLYNYEKVSVKTQVTEKIYGELKESELEPLVASYVNKATQTTTDNEYVKKISKNKITNEPVNKYEQVSTVKTTYNFAKRCVSTDGLAKVTKADGSGICYQTKDEYGRVTPVYAQNVYYTNLSIDEGNHSIDTYVTIGREVKEENNYYEAKESCNFNVGKANPYLSCDIKLVPDTGTEMLGDSIFEGGNVTATILPQDNLDSDDYISGYKIKIGNTTYDGKSHNFGISDKKLGLQEIKIVGTVTSAKGNETTCSKTIYVIDPDDACGVKCELKEVKETLYEIVSTGSQTSTAYYRALSIDMTQRKVYKSVVDQKYYVGLDSPLSSIKDKNLTFFGIVEGTLTTNGQKCKNVCHKSMESDEEKSNCYKDFKPAEILSIKEYCNSNYDKDINDFDSSEQCIRMCTNRCDEDIKRNLEKVKTYCRENAASLGFANENICINACYKDDPSGGNEYIYRPINNANPFPNSYDSEDPYEKGKRIVGANWVGFTDYIKHDDDDTTSVTGVYGNQHVEYIIDLSSGDLQAIQKDSESLDNPYQKYEYTTTSDNQKYVKKYESRFIHEDFENLFRKDLT